jgi:hypothetical protein
MKAERVRRAPINGTRNVLNVKGKDPDSEYRVVNDVGDRIQEFQELGYEIVMDKNIQVGDKRVAIPTAEGSPVKVSVGVKQDGSPLYAYVMKQRKEWYKEDQDAKAARIKELEDSMKAEAQKNSDYGKLQIA